jgi:hypothetical protein
MNIVFPMAGLSQRFAIAGYDRPKYMLDLHGMSVFRHVVLGFSAYFSIARFIFIARDLQGTAEFIRNECLRMSVSNFDVHLLDQSTRGQAETVALGLAGRTRHDSPLTIFNIDTFRAGSLAPSAFDAQAVDGYLEVFRGSGANWSFVRPADTARQTVAETAEKRPISDLCCTGLYHFRRYDAFLRAFETEVAAGPRGWAKGELFVAPLYNCLIAEGADIRYSVVSQEQVRFCGTPEEYERHKIELSDPT